MKVYLILGPYDALEINFGSIEKKGGILGQELNNLISMRPHLTLISFIKQLRRVWVEYQIYSNAWEILKWRSTAF